MQLKKALNFNTLRFGIAYALGLLALPVLECVDFVL